MNLLSILSKYKVSDLEEESKKTQPVSGLSPNEAWELEKQTNPNPDYPSWHTRTIVQNISNSLGNMNSQSITIEE